MAKLYTIVAIIAVTMALVAAEPPRFGIAQRLGALKKQKINKLFGRQEAAPDATTTSAPYAAAGVTPEVPFELPTETEASIPDQTYGPPEPTPDQTYGPPEQIPDQTYGPPEPTPDQTYGPPAITEPDNSYGPPAAEEIHPFQSNLLSENFIQPRNNFGLSRTAPLRLRSAAVRSRSAPLRFHPIKKRSNIVEIIRSQPVLVYTLH